MKTTIAIVRDRSRSRDWVRKRRRRSIYSHSHERYRSPSISRSCLSSGSDTTRSSSVSSIDYRYRSRSRSRRRSRTRSRSHLRRRSRTRSRSHLRRRHLIRRSRTRSQSRLRRRSRTRSRSHLIRRSRTRSRSHLIRRSRTRSRSHLIRRSRTRSRSRDWYCNPSDGSYYFRSRAWTYRCYQPEDRRRRSRSHSRRRRRHSKSNKLSAVYRHPSYERFPIITIYSDSDTTTSDEENDNQDNDTQAEDTHCNDNRNEQVLEEIPKTWVDCDIGNLLKRNTDFCSVLKNLQPTEFQTRLFSSINTGRDVISIEEYQHIKDDSLPFGIPIFKHTIDRCRSYETRDLSPLALILAPTQSKVSRIVSQCGPLADKLCCKYVCLDDENRGRNLKDGCAFVISTPGRLMEMIDTLDGCFEFSPKTINLVIVADADVSCRMGLAEQTRLLLDRLNPKKQVVITASTLSESVSSLADTILNNPIMVPGGYSSLTSINSHVSVRDDENSKLNSLITMLREASEISSEESCLILVDSEGSVKTMVEEFKKNAISCYAFDKEDMEDNKNITTLRSSKVIIMKRSDNHFTREDFPKISTVFNYNCPVDFQSYIKSSRLLATEDSRSSVHTFITRDQGHLSGILVAGLTCSMSSIPGNLQELHDSYIQGSKQTRVTK